ncbi:MAG: cytochrome-c oxidase, cbb3-type subunit III [Emcibacteraceae bacterium]
MSEKNIDQYSGRETTGHEWNGITELDTPIPKAIWIFLTVATICAIIMWILLPSWPLGSTYTKGLLGADERETVKENLTQANLVREPWEVRLAKADYPDLKNDNELTTVIMRNGKRLFEDNCAMCHGRDAKGGHGYPNLTDKQWLWGGDPDTILETINIGINSGHEDSRASEMMAFGRDGILNVEDRKNVIYFVQSLSGTNISTTVGDDVIAAGAKVFSENCAVCHGENGEGQTELGAPNLTDPFWIYGNDYETMSSVLRDGRQGVMPFWSERLSLPERKILSFYILKLGETD